MSSDVATAEDELEDQTEEHAYVAETKPAAGLSKM